MACSYRCIPTTVASTLTMIAESIREDLYNQSSHKSSTTSLTIRESCREIQGVSILGMRLDIARAKVRDCHSYPICLPDTNVYMHFFLFIPAPQVYKISVRRRPHTLDSHKAAAPALKSPEAAQPHPPTSSRFLRLLPIPAEPRIELSSHSAQCKASGLSDPSPRSGSDGGPSFRYQRSRCSNRCQGHGSEQG